MEFRSSVYPVHCSAPLFSVPQAVGKQDIPAECLNSPSYGYLFPSSRCSRCLAQTLGFCFFNWLQELFWTATHCSLRWRTVLRWLGPPYPRCPGATLFSFPSLHRTNLGNLEPMTNKLGGRGYKSPPHLSPGRIDSAVHFPSRAPMGSGHILIWLLLFSTLCPSLYHNFSREHFLAKSLDKNPHLRLCIN